MVTIRFVGHRIGVTGDPGPMDSFSVSETVDQVLPGSGRIAITTRVGDLTPGEWQVSATAAGEPPRIRGRGSRRVARTRLPDGSALGPTGFAPIMRVRAPGARLGAWPALVSLGAVIALVVQGVFGAYVSLPGDAVLIISLIAMVAGLVGARVYYLALHRGELRPPLSAGVCIQGFVLGAVSALVIGALGVGIPVGRLLDVTVPGLLIGMMIGRLGCFAGGCCVGRPSASRWALWSTDQRLGTRRIPTQLIESALAGGLGAAALLVVWVTTVHPAGAVFIGTIAAYTFGRQLLFPLRDLPRRTTRGRAVVTLAAGLAVAIALVAAALA